MKPFVCILIGCMLIAGPIGCAVQHHLRRGDAARVAEQPRVARDHYLQALEAKPDLSQNEQFTTNLNVVRSRAVLLEARALLDQNGWEPAIEKLRLALKYDPRSDPAGRLLDDAQRLGASAEFTSAQKRAEHGDLEPAIKHLHEALRWNPNHDQAQTLLANLTKEHRANQEKANRFFEQAVQLQQSKQWSRAIEPLECVLELDRDHGQARIALAKSKRMLDQAESAWGEAAEQFEEKQLDGALDCLERALDVWPRHKKALTLVKRVNADRTAVQRHLNQAQGFINVGHWDEALKAVDAAEALHPHHRSIHTLRDHTHQLASQTLINEATERLDEGAWDEADALYGRALAYRFSVEAKEGRAAVAGDRGRAAEKQGQSGKAWQWYQEAQSHVPASPMYTKDLQRVRREILTRHRFDICIATEHRPNGHLQEESANLTRTIIALVEECDLPFLTIREPDESDQVPSYVVTVSDLTLSTHQHRRRTERKQHGYTAYRTVPNPHLGSLRAALHNAEIELAHLRRHQNRKCSRCGGHGHLPCTHCGGRRQIKCGHCHGGGFNEKKARRSRCPDCRGHRRQTDRCTPCRGTGHILQTVVGADCYVTKDRRRRCSACQDARKKKTTCNQCSRSGRVIVKVKVKVKGKSKKVHKTCGQCGGRGRHRVPVCLRCSGSGTIHIHAERSRCGHCHGRGHVSCTSCNHDGHISCSRCKGSGWIRSVTRHQLHEKQCKIYRLRHKLYVTSDTVTRSYRAYWPYTVCHFRKTGQLRAWLTIRDGHTNHVIDRYRIKAHVSSHDTTIEQPNVELGLSADELNLPSDDEVHQCLIDRAAKYATSRLLKQIRIHHSKLLQEDSVDHETHERPNQSQEYQVAATLIKDHVARASRP